jgi:hypothetical protein
MVLGQDVDRRVARPGDSLVVEREGNVYEGIHKWQSLIIELLIF